MSNEEDLLVTPQEGTGAAPVMSYKLKQKIAKYQAGAWRYVKVNPLPAPKARRLGLEDDEAKASHEAGLVKIAQPYEGVLVNSEE